MNAKTVHQEECEMLLLIRDQLILYGQILESKGEESFSLFQLKLKTEQLLTELGLRAPEGSCGECKISVEDMESLSVLFKH